MELRPPRTVLQFASTLLSHHPEDRGREFIVAYHVEDRAFAIAERSIPNSGFPGGKFMEKTKLNNPKTGKPYEPSEIFVGATLELAGRNFILQEASEDALKFMEARSDVFTKCDLSDVMKGIREQIAQKSGPQLLVEFQKLDAKKKGSVSMEEAQTLLGKFGISLGDQEYLTLFRRYWAVGDRFDYELFVRELI